MRIWPIFRQILIKISSKIAKWIKLFTTNSALSFQSLEAKEIQMFSYWEVGWISKNSIQSISFFSLSNLYFNLIEKANIFDELIYMWITCILYNKKERNEKYNLNGQQLMKIKIKWCGSITRIYLWIYKSSLYKELNGICMNWAIQLNGHLVHWYVCGFKTRCFGYAINSILFFLNVSMKKTLQFWIKNFWVFSYLFQEFFWRS